MEIRNEIEHEDKRPPKLERCLELLDVVWYFLRTTDRIVRVRTDTLLFEAEDGPYWVEVNIQIKRTWKTSMRGWVPAHFIFYRFMPDQCQVLSDELTTNRKWKRQGQHPDKNPSDLYFSGEVIQLPDKTAFAQQYFSSI
jgi:hypothetical protein